MSRNNPGNATFGAIVQLLEKEISEKEIVAALKSRFDANEELIASDVKKALENLRAAGALEE
ncbi:MAG: PqqD family protein [Clostridia bacterium]|nr:PqqD family protein [Clostridia bacterium]